jgi:hypothetical protein
VPQNLASPPARRDVYPARRDVSLATNTAIALGIGKDSITAKPRPTVPYVLFTHRFAANALRS